MKPIPSSDEEAKVKEANEGLKRIPDFEELVEHLGQFGNFQKWLYFLLWLPAGAMSIGIYASVFLEFVPGHHCDNGCPSDAQGWLKDIKDPSCTIPRSFNETCQVDNITDVVTCDKFIFDDSLFSRTVITDFGAVCGNSFMRTTSATVYMSGQLFGSLLIGWLADVRGRRTAFALSVLCLAVGSIAAAFSVNYPMYMVFRFITSMGGMGSFMTSFVLATEFVGTKYRTVCGIMIEVPFALGELYIALLAYYIRDWVHLQLVVGLPFLILLVYMIKLPESVRWAWAVQKFKSANNVIAQMAKINKVNVPEEYFVEETVMEVEKVSSNEVGMGSLLVSKPLVGRLIVMAFNWIVATLCFYGLSLNAGIGSDVFSAFSLSAVMEIPAYCFSAMSVGMWGRKPFLMFVQILCGISCILAGVIEDPNVRLGFSLLGKFGSSAAFSIVFLYTAELFPTSMRNSAVGLCSTLARFGGILAPTVAELGYSRPQMPFFIFGIATLIGGLASFLLPETKGKKLPDSVQEAVKM